MNLLELTTELVTTLRRPDMVGVIKSYVRQVVVQCHAATQFQRDLVEEIIPIPSPAPVVKITQPPRLRTLMSLSPCDAYGMRLATRNPEGGYSIVAPNDIMTMSGNEMVDIAYIAGPTITVRSSVASSHMFIQYYQTPDIRDDNTQTWIMEQFPELIMSGVRARYYQSTNNQQAAGESQMFLADLQDLVAHLGGVR